jgi:hypothetical protein
MQRWLYWVSGNVEGLEKRSTLLQKNMSCIVYVFILLQVIVSELMMKEDYIND